MRKKLIVGNWKMNGSLQFNAELLQQLKAELVAQVSDKQVALCVPFVYLSQLQQLLSDCSIALGVQDISQYTNGAYTGEISATMLQDFAIQYAIVGHSERRSYHGETDLTVAAKTLAALKAGIKPIICVGETLEQRQAEQTKAVVLQQLRAVLQEVVRQQPKFLLQCTVAYEPVWAIGTGQTASAQQAQQVHAWLRSCIGEFDEAISSKICILYGGSMNAGNAANLLAQPDIDGGLIGGASLKAKDFASIINA